ncbi:MAG: hypothetical protein K5705_04250 [Oscillospiraceae bacterium]|nr:hypothetical protein [Oscillospiraceae bacterium]MCR4759467.1 hypothetical protein [Oscillospiraceae bacterium]
METYNPEQLQEAYRALQSGDPRMRAIRAAITEAERAQDDASALMFHHDLIHESVFSGDRYQALVDFPQYLAILQRNPELDAEWNRDTLWMYKWIVEAATEFYQIEKKQVLRWFSDFRRDLLKNGYSLRSWYEKRAIFYQYCDRAKMRMDYADFLDAPKDSMCDGRTTDLDSQVRFELQTGNLEKALKAADEIFKNHLRTEEVPCKTYYSLLADAMKRGDMEAAAQYAKPLKQLCTGRRFQLEPIGMMLCYYACVNPEEGLAFYAENRSLREGSRNPFLCFWFDRGAARVLYAAAEAGLSMKEMNGTELLPEQLNARADELLENCRQIAGKFDARNGSDYFSAALSE